MLDKNDKTIIAYRLKHTFHQSEYFSTLIFMNRRIAKYRIYLSLVILKFDARNLSHLNDSDIGKYCYFYHMNIDTNKLK